MKARRSLTRLAAIVGWWACAAAGQAQTAAAPAAPASAAAMPAQACLSLLDRMAAGLPREETGPVLRSKGLRIRNPIVVPPGVITNTKVASAVRLRVLIDNQGRVLPGSVRVEMAEGDPRLAEAMPAVVEATLSFDVSGAPAVPPQFAFSTVYVSCAQP